MAKKTTKTKRAANTKAEADLFRVPRSALALAEAIRRRVKTSPGYWQQVQTAMRAASAGIPFRKGKRGAGEANPTSAPVTH